MPLDHIVHTRPAPPAVAGVSVQFDASPWGGGAVLRRNEQVVEYFSVKWRRSHAAHLNVVIGKSKFQTFFEFLTLLLALMVWGKEDPTKTLAVLGDNTGALQEAISLSGKGILLAVSRELSWRAVKFGWPYEVGHLPSQKNVLADWLSRLHCPEDSASFPTSALGHAVKRLPPNVSKIWAARVQ